MDRIEPRAVHESKRMGPSTPPLVVGALVLCALVLVAVSPTASAARVRGSVSDVPRLAAAIDVRLDELRVSRGLPRLVVSPALAAAARLHTRQMLTTGRFQHPSPDGSPFWKRIARFYGSV